MGAELLPDSRLKEKKGTVMVDFLMTDGTMQKLEMEPIYCANCGKPNGYVPCAIMAWVTWLCIPCSEKYGAAADKLMAPDQQFWDDVAHEMERRFGFTLTHEQLVYITEQAELGRELELLERESPYRRMMPT